MKRTINKKLKNNLNTTMIPPLKHLRNNAIMMNSSWKLLILVKNKI